MVELHYQFMKITILTFGSAGDVVPYISLAKGLKDRGHIVILAAPKNFEDEIRQNNIQYQPLPGDIQAFINSKEGMEGIAAGNLKALMAGINKLTHDLRYELQESATTTCVDADLIIGGSLMSYYAALISEKLQKPLMFANVNPINVSTRAFPHFLVAQKILPMGFLNALTYSLFFKALYKQKSPECSEWRKRSGFESKLGMVHLRIIQQKIPVLHGYSSELLSKPPDWKSFVSVTGFWKTEMKDKNYQIPPVNLVNWLNAGKPPIYFGFGSMPVFHPKETMNMIQGICRELDVRGIINAGWSELEMKSESSDNSIFFNRQYVDLEWLFPKCSILVHHGGVGTTHIGIEAGIPTVICSIFADNPLWGEQFKRLNIGSHIRFKELTREKLINAIKQVQDEGVRKNAILIGNRIKSENGLKTAIDFIEQQMPVAPVYRNDG